MSFQIPKQDQRYADSGRRNVIILDKVVPASLKKLRPSEEEQFQATHEIYISRLAGVNAGIVIDFDGKKYRVTKVLDPRPNDPDMKGRYMRLICVSAD